MEDFREIVKKLKEPFPPEQHLDRKLPGGGRWFYVPWQNIRQRLDDVYPEWKVSWTNPTYVGDYCHISCTITIAGVSREAPGNAPIQLVSGSGKDMSRGTPLERAVADAFKNAAEAFGVGGYLDDQRYTEEYLKSKGDLRGYKYRRENEQIEVGARGTPINNPKRQEVERNGQLVQVKSTVISEGQNKRLWAIAKGVDPNQVRTLIKQIAGVEHPNEIPTAKYDAVIAAIEKAKTAAPLAPAKGGENPAIARVSAVRQTLNIPKPDAQNICIGLYNADNPIKLSPVDLEDFICEMCMHWAALLGADRQKSLESYQQVLTAISIGVPEVKAISDWMKTVRQGIENKKLVTLRGT